MTRQLTALVVFVLTATISLGQTLKPTDKLALLTGTVTNFKAKPLVKETIILENEKTREVVKVNTGEKGRFEVLVPVNATYNIKYRNFTSDMVYSKMKVPADKEATYEVTIRIEPAKEFILDNVYFDTGKSTLKPASFKALNDLVEVLKLKNSMVIEIQGHTDDVGSIEDNNKLSQSRAEAVKKYLLSKGIDEARVSAKGYGPTMPIADNSTEEGRSKNRRTSLKVIKE